MAFSLSILTPEVTLFEAEVKGVTLPGQEGVFSILKGHMSLIAALTLGSIKVQLEDREESFEIAKGFVTTDGETCKVLIEK